MSRCTAKLENKLYVMFDVAINRFNMDTSDGRDAVGLPSLQLIGFQ